MRAFERSCGLPPCFVILTSALLPSVPVMVTLPLVPVIENVASSSMSNVFVRTVSVPVTVAPD
jgi:hypothetical protein